MATKNQTAKQNETTPVNPPRQGPEDALGNEPTQHDYSDRLGDANYRPHQGEAPQTPSTPEG